VSFAHPERLWLVTILPGLIFWAVRGRMRRARDWRALAQRGRVPRDGTGLTVVSIALVIVGLAQPRWGRLAAPPLPPGHDVVLLVDVSKSMGVLDAVPSRLAVAVEAAESLVNALASEPANRVAVVAFAGRGVIRCPLTENLGAVLDALHRLRPGVVRPGGTDLGAALEVGRDALGPEPHAAGRAIVIFSDGEDHLDRWAARVDRLKQEDIVVHAVAIGDPDQRHPVPDGKTSEPLLYRGEAVLSRRVDTALEAIVAQTDGSLVRLGLASGDLGVLYQTKIEPAARRRRESTRPADRTERFPLFLISALTFLVAGCGPATRRWNWPWHWSVYVNWQSRRFLRKAGITAAMLVLTGLGLGAGQAIAPTKPASAAQAISQGQAAYQLGHWEAALAAFETAISRAPESAIPRYDAGAALYQLGRHAEARQHYNEARERADRSLRTKIDYALGNTALAAGDLPEAIRSYDACVASTSPGPALDAVRRDAAINRKFALEQPQALSPQDEKRSGDAPRPRDPQRRKNANRKGQGNAPSADGEPEDDPGGGGGDQPDRDQKPRGRRRMGGAGGGRTSPPGARGDTPDDRLDAALEHIRDAQKRRLPDEQPPVSASDDRKDW
jgi:Ca-activated chloride channel family protein